MQQDYSPATRGQEGMMITYWFAYEGPEFDSLDDAKADWLTDHDYLPTSYHWREYDGDTMIAEGSTALEPPYGTVVYWEDPVYWGKAQREDMTILFDAREPRAFWNAIERAVREGRIEEASAAVGAFDDITGWDAAEQSGVTGGYTLARTAALDALDIDARAGRE